MNRYGFLKPKWFNEFFDNMDKNSINIYHWMVLGIRDARSCCWGRGDDEGDDVKLSKPTLSTILMMGVSTDTSSSSDSESSTSEDEEDDVIILEQVEETTSVN